MELLVALAVTANKPLPKLLLAHLDHLALPDLLDLKVNLVTRVPLVLLVALDPKDLLDLMALLAALAQLANAVPTAHLALQAHLVSQEPRELLA